MAADAHRALAASLAQTRSAIARIADQRHEAERKFATVMVNEAQLQQALRDQQTYLDRTREEIEQARDLAQRAAEQARANGLDPAPYEQTAAGLLREAEVIAAARRQLAAADETSRQNLERARDLMRGNRDRLDASLGEQLRLLAQLEQLGRERRGDQAG